MKQLISLLLIPAFAAPAAALTVRETSSRSGYSNQCFEQVYREEYIPGTRAQPGRVRRWTETREVSCGYAGGNTVIQEDPFPINPRAPRAQADENSCIEGALLGGILGGGAGYASSRGDGRGWAIPLGIVAGTLVGCQVDGG